MSANIAAIQDLTIGYRRSRGLDYTVARNLSLSLIAGELVCLIGPNGVGKSTLLRTLAGMQPPLAGSVLLDGQDIRTIKPRELARRLSVVLTEQVNVGIMSAYALVALGRIPYTDWTGKLTPHDEKVIRSAILAVGASELSARNVSDLSDGERQKIMIARALAQEPTLMILDEPTAYLDLPRRVEVMRILRRLARTSGSVVLLSTHDLDLALRSADSIWLMRAGGVIEVGAPEDLVLTGAFEATFGSEGVQFDCETGSFKLHGDQEGGVCVRGAGIAMLWTKRALEREGFYVEEDGAAALACIEVITTDSGTVWSTTVGGTRYKHSNLHATIAFLRRSVMPHS